MVPHFFRGSRCTGPTFSHLSTQLASANLISPHHNKLHIILGPPLTSCKVGKRYYSTYIRRGNSNASHGHTAVLLRSIWSHAYLPYRWGSLALTSLLCTYDSLYFLCWCKLGMYRSEMTFRGHQVDKSHTYRNDISPSLSHCYQTSCRLRRSRRPFLFYNFRNSITVFKYGHNWGILFS